MPRTNSIIENEDLVMERASSLHTATRTVSTATGSAFRKLGLKFELSTSRLRLIDAEL